MKLQGKVAVVTGGSSGIGKATALLFASEGAKIVVVYSKSEKEAEAVVAEIIASGQEGMAICCDVSDESAVKSMIEQVINRFGRLDILVNAAGIVFDVPFAERTVEHWRRTLAVDLIGPFLCAKYAAPYLLESHGSIVNVSSNNGMFSFSPDSMDYDSAKAGLNALTKNLSIQLGPSVRVNAVAPGWIDTPMNKDLPKEYLDAEVEKSSLKRIGAPEEIAKAILFLASDDASFVTGSILLVDGGYR